MTITDKLFYQQVKTRQWAKRNSIEWPGDEEMRARRWQEKYLEELNKRVDRELKPKPIYW